MQTNGTRALHLVLLLVASCSRPHGGAHGASCSEHKDCDDRYRCLDGTCVEAAVFTMDTICRTSKECREEGRCSAGPLPPEVFLGPSELGCVRTREEDCAASRECLERGKCALFGTEPYRKCVPARPEHCTAAQDCERFDECVLESESYGAHCERSYPKATGALEFEQRFRSCKLEDSFRELAQKKPEGQKHALLCYLEKEDDFDSLLLAINREERITLRWDSDLQSVVFALPLVVEPGQRVSLILRDNEAIGAHPNRFISMRMEDGTSHAAVPGAKVWCSHVSQATSRELAKPALELAEVYRQYASSRVHSSASSLQLDINTSDYWLGQAACALGWDDPSLQKKREQLRVLAQSTAKPR